VKFGTALPFINTTIKYVAVTKYVPDIFPEKAEEQFLEPKIICP
jgi:hypothetical protein